MSDFIELKILIGEAEIEYLGDKYSGLNYVLYILDRIKFQAVSQSILHAYSLYNLVKSSIYILASQLAISYLTPWMSEIHQF